MDGTLGAGKKMRGKLAYELSNDWKELEVDIDLTALSLSTDGKIKISKKDEIISSSLVTYKGKIVHEGTLEAIKKG